MPRRAATSPAQILLFPSGDTVPSLDVEGRRLWIVGMAPMGMARVVKTKYCLASMMSLVVTSGLIVLSCHLLKMSWDRVAFFGAVIGVMTFALNGLAVGLGVLYPNFKDANPAKIVSGFGGTLCLVLSSFYIIASVLLLGFGAGGLHARAGGIVSRHAPRVQRMTTMMVEWNLLTPRFI